MSAFTRADLFHAVFPDTGHIDVASFIPYLEASKSEFATALSAWQKEKERSPSIDSASSFSSFTTEEQAAQLRLVNSLSDITDNNPSIINAIRSQHPQAVSLRDVALG